VTIFYQNIVKFRQASTSATEIDNKKITVNVAAVSCLIQVPLSIRRKIV